MVGEQNLLFTMSWMIGGRCPLSVGAVAPSCRGRNSGSMNGRHWWSLSGSNRRPPACKAGALPAELRPLCVSSASAARRWPKPACTVVGLDGLEPSTLRLSGVRSNHLSYRPAVGSTAIHKAPRARNGVRAIPAALPRGEGREGPT